MKPEIPFNRPYVGDKELTFLRSALESEKLGGDGPYTQACHDFFESELGVAKALLTTSCTDALEMAALLLDLHDGDEVIVPSFTFVSSANAFALHGAKPVFVDIRPDTFNLDEEKLPPLISKSTRAIVAVHYAGVGCEMDTIRALAQRVNAVVIEDNAMGLFGKYKGHFLGSLGDIAVQSFHETKNLSCGEGGALLINDPQYVERAEIMREKGTDRSRFLRGAVDKYTWVDLGSSYLPSDILAALLLAQLENREEIQSRRHVVWKLYHDALLSLEKDGDLQLPHVPEGCEHPAHAFPLLATSEEERERLIDHLAFEGVKAVAHYAPLHLSRMGKHFGGQPGDCPIAENVAARILRLPLHAHLSKEDGDRVAAAVLQFYR